MVVPATYTSCLRRLYPHIALLAAAQFTGHTLYCFVLHCTACLQYEGEIHVTVIATGFESGTPYRNERKVMTFANSFAQLAEERGAKIPPFLLNRQNKAAE